MLKKGIGFLGLLLLLLGYILLHSDFVLNPVRDLAAAPLSRLLNQPVAIDKTALTLIPPSLHLTGVMSRGKISFSAEEVRITVSLWSLMTPSWVIREIFIRHPSLALDPSSFQWTSQGRSVIIQKIKIEEGALSYVTDRGRLFLPHLNAAIFPNRTMNRFDVTFSGKEGHLLKTPLTFLQGTFVIDEKKIRIDAAKVLFNKADATLHGVIPLGRSFTATDVDLAVNTRGPLEEYRALLPFKPYEHSRFFEILKTLSGEAVVKSHIRGTLSNPTITGVVTATPNEPRPLSAGGGMSAVTPVTSFAATFIYKSKMLTLENIAAGIFSGHLSGSVKVPFLQENGPYRLKLQYDQISADQALSFLMPQTNTASFSGKTLKGKVSLSGKGTAWTTSGNLELTPAPMGMDGSEAHRVAKQSLSSPEDICSGTALCPQTLSWFSRITKGQWQWTGSDKAIHLEQAEISFPGGTASFPGRWDQKTGLLLQVKAESSDIKPVAETIHFPVSGQLHLMGTLTGALAQPFFSGHLQLADFKIKENPFGLFQTDLFYLNKTILFRKGVLNTKTGNAQGSGIIRFEREPAYYVASQIEHLDPQKIITLFTRKVRLATTASGELRIQGEIGKQHTLIVDGPLTVGEGVLYGESFQKGKLHLTVTEKKVQIENVRLENEGGVAQGSGEISYKGAYRLNTTASVQKFQTRALIHTADPGLSGDMRLTVRGEGTLKQPNLKFDATFEKLHYHETPFGSGMLQVDWRQGKVTTVSHFPNRFSFSGKMATQAPHPFSFQTEFSHFPIHAFFMKNRLSMLSGFALHASGDVTGSGEMDRLGELDLSSRVTLLSAKKGDYRLTNNGPIEFSAQKGTFSITNGSFRGTHTNLLISGGGTLFREWGVLVKGEADIQILRLLTSKVQSGKGIARLDLKITDRWKKPKINGIFSLQEGTIYLAGMTQPVRISSIAVLFNQHHLLIESADGQVGRGRFSGVGKAVLEGWNLKQFGVTFDLAEMPLVWAAPQTPGGGILSGFLGIAGAGKKSEPMAVVDGTLFYRGDAKEQSLEGTLHLRRVMYQKPINLQEMLLQWKSGGERLPVAMPTFGDTRLSIHLYGKEDIGIDNNVAKVALDVDLQMKGTLDHPLLFGQVNLLAGTFRFRAADFKVTSGTVQFTHPTKMDPVFDIQGESRMRDYLLELSLQGRLTQSTLNLSATPSLSRADILSLVATGKTTHEIATAGEEAKTFIVSDWVAGFLAEPVKQLTGVSRINVGPTGAGMKGTKSSESTLVSVERYLLNDQLLVVYSTALDTSEENSIVFFYDMGKHLSVAGGRDEDGQIGGDIRFRHEFR